MTSYKAIDHQGIETPFMDLDGLKYLRDSGQISDESLILVQGDSKWVALGVVLSGGGHLAPAPAQQEPPMPPPAPAMPTLAPSGVSAGPVNQTLKLPGIPAGYYYAREPWSRLWAYWMDSLIITAIAGLGLGLFNLYPIVGDGTQDSVNFLMNMVFCWTAVPFGVALCQSIWGTTPGKSFFGIRILHPDGTNPTFSEALKRNYRILVSGLYLAIPIVYLFGANAFYTKLRAGKMPVWDEGSNSAYQFNPEMRRTGLMWAVAILGCIFMVILKSMAASARR